MIKPFVRQQRKPKVYAFIDSQNLNVGIQKFGWKMDWSKFRKFLTDEYGVDKAFMFIGYVPEFEAMYEQLHQTGFAIVLKPTFDMTRVRPEVVEPKPGEPEKEEEKRPTKGNVDADLVLWAMKELPNYQKAVLVSGDGDFYSLVEYLDSKNRLLKLLTPNGQYSNLYNKYEQYIDQLDKRRPLLAYHQHKRHRPNSKSHKN
ncbi:MAG: NYN domain-containing protein [Candidatus Saccharimonadales bacterium]